MTIELIFRPLVAGLLGAIIGLDRAYRAKEAGFRTHFLVCLGSALFMVVSQYGFSDVLQEGITRFDPGRIAAQVVSGIGFIGAGTIIIHRQFVRGLTTAAGLWATSGIGLAIGGGLYWLGIAATAFTLLGLELLTILFKKTGIHSCSIKFSTGIYENIAKTTEMIRQQEGRITSYEPKSAPLVMTNDITYRSLFDTILRKKNLISINTSNSFPTFSLKRLNSH